MLLMMLIHSSYSYYYYCYLNCYLHSYYDVGRHCYYYSRPLRPPRREVLHDIVPFYSMIRYRRRRRLRRNALSRTLRLLYYTIIIAYAFWPVFDINQMYLVPGREFTKP